MRFIRIIDLLDKIANEEAPLKIKYEYLIYELTPERNDYYCKNAMRWFTNEINSLGVLNDEVEIIEEDKKIRKILLPSFEEFKNMTSMERYEVTAREYDLLDTIVDEINKLKENSGK